MKPWALAVSGILTAGLALGGFLRYQDGLVPVPLADGTQTFVLARPEFGEDAAKVEVVLAPGDATEAFLVRQCEPPLIQANPSGGWTGVLVTELAVSRHGKRLRFRLHPGWRLHQGGELDASRLKAFWAPLEGNLGFQVRPVDAATLEVRFKERPQDPAGWLARWLIPGTGPFLLQGTTLTRFDGFVHGKAGMAEIQVLTDPAHRESRAWADGLAAGRWAWAVFPGRVAPEDMARVRLAPYDEIRMKDGTVWFLSRRMRRLRPDLADWTRTPLFGAWQGAMDLPYDPLGL